MAQRYNFFYFEAEFKKYLIAGNAEASTIKNYLSDLHYFFSWVQNGQKIDEISYSELRETFDHSLIRSYNAYLISSTTSTKTIDRRISTIRKFFRLCIDQRWLTSNPAEEFDSKTKQEERDEIVMKYKKNLEEKNYQNSNIARHINVIKDLITNSNIL